jgi:hypothetical protein
VKVGSKVKKSGQGWVYCTYGVKALKEWLLALVGYYTSVLNVDIQNVSIVKLDINDIKSFSCVGNGFKYYDGYLETFKNNDLKSRIYNGDIVYYKQDITDPEKQMCRYYGAYDPNPFANYILTDNHNEIRVYNNIKVLDKLELNVNDVVFGYFNECDEHYDIINYVNVQKERVFKMIDEWV